LVIGVMDILSADPDLTEVARHSQGRCSGTGSAGVSLDLKVGSQRWGLGEGLGSEGQKKRKRQEGRERKGWGEPAAMCGDFLTAVQIDPGRNGRISHWLSKWRRSFGVFQR
jgi:hypothetical protein